MKKECLICKGNIERKGQSIGWFSNAKYCSQLCYRKRIVSMETRVKMSIKSLGNKHSLGYKHSQEARNNMSQAQMGRVCHWKGKKLSEEHRAKVVAALMKNPHRFKKGDVAWNYKGDRSQVVKNEKKHLDGRYKAWMRQVKNRDYWKCQISNDDCSGRVEAHHILPWRDFEELRYEIKNGITLCHFHHPRKRVEEARLAPMFEALVRAKMQ